MSLEHFSLEFFSEKGLEFKESIFWVKLEDVTGPIMIYVNHVPILSALKNGEMSFQTINGETKSCFLEKGWFFADNEKCQVFKIY